MPNSFKRRTFAVTPSNRLLRAGQHLGVAALAVFFGCGPLQNAVANGDTRALSFRHLHTGETLTITYKKDGRYDEEALKKLNWELRDWRRSEATRMDPKVLDAVWELYREVGASEPIEIICGYRAPATNEMLRRRSSGVARASQHTLGKAIDLHIPGVSLERQREAALRLQRGGVGYYPSSTFIHVDVGNIRHWPRMTYAQLSKVFPDGRTVHIPTNGKPLPGYKLALADVANRGSTLSPRSLDEARLAGLDVAATKAQPSKLAAKSGNTTPDADDDEDDAPAATAVPRNAPEAKVVAAVAVAAPKTESRVAAAAPAPAKAAAPVVMASADGFVPVRAVTAPAKPDTTAAIGSAPRREEPRNDRVPLDIALAYAADTADAGSPSIAPTAPVAARRNIAAKDEATIPAAGEKLSARLITDAAAPLAASPGVAPAAKQATAGMLFDDPWLRAAMIAPSLYTAFTTSRSGDADYGSLQSLMAKPRAAVMMTFSRNPTHGLRYDSFSGDAVVFVSTVTFQRTALLQ